MCPERNMPQDQSQDQSTWAWDLYWQADQAGSCAAIDGRGEEASIVDDWRAFFASFNDGARLLDIGTGNGAVALIAAEVAAETGRRFDIHGIDTADIDPPRFVPARAELLRTIRFQGRTPAERLPFEAGTVDGISGQHALEYTDADRSVPELVRVLRPGGRVRLVMHARDSAIVAANQAKIDHSRYLLRDSGLFAAAVAVVEAASRADREPGGSASPAMARAAETFQTLRASAAERLGGGPGRHLLDQITGAFDRIYQARGRYPPDRLTAMIRGVAAQLEAERQRMDALCAAALNEPAARRIADLFTSAGCDRLELTEVTAGTGETIGWRLATAKP